MTVRELVTKFVFKANTKDIDKFKTGITGLKTASDKAAKLIAGVGIAATGLAYAAYRAAKAHAEMGDGIAKAADKTGQSTQSIQKWIAIGKAQDIEQDTMISGLKKFNLNLGLAHQGNKEAIKGFAALGISLKDSNGNWKSTDEVVLQAQDHIRQMKDPSAQAAATMKIFGKSGMELLPVLRMNNKEFYELYNHDPKFSAGQIKAAQELDDALKEQKKTIGGVVHAISAKLVPIVMPLVKNITAWIKANKELILSKVELYVNKLAASVNTLMKKDWSKVWKAIDMVGSALFKIITFMIDNAKGVTYFIAALAGGVILVKLASFAIAVIKIVAAIKAFLAVLGTLGVILGTILGILGAIIAGAAAGAAIGYMLGEWLGLTNKLVDALMWIEKFLGKKKKMDFGKNPLVGSVNEQAASLGQMMGKGIKSFQTSSGRKTLNLDTAMEAIKTSKNFKSLDKTKQDEMLAKLPDIIKANAASSKVTNNNTFNPVINIQNGNDPNLAKKISEKLISDYRGALADG